MKRLNFLKVFKSDFVYFQGILFRNYKTNVVRTYDNWIQIPLNEVKHCRFYNILSVLNNTYILYFDFKHNGIHEYILDRNT